MASLEQIKFFPVSLDKTDKTSCKGISIISISRFKAVYQFFSDVFGVPLKSKNADELLDEDVEKLIEERNEARKNKENCQGFCKS